MDLFLGQIFVAGRFRVSNMSLKEKCCWEIDNSGSLRGFGVYSPELLVCAIRQAPLHPATTEGFNFALGRTHFPYRTPRCCKRTTFLLFHHVFLGILRRQAFR